jgi:hypothetical protein
VEAWATSASEWARGLELSRALERVHRPEGASVRDVRGDAFLLRERGFDRVVLTWRRDGPDTDAMALVVRSFGEPVAKAPRGAVWAVPAVEATPHEAALWREHHELRLATPRGGEP